MYSQAAHASNKHRASPGSCAAPDIKQMVTFAPLNLAADDYPSLATNTTNMDIILCRNVLMYFTPQCMAQVIGNFHKALVVGGWLIVSPAEASHVLFPQYERVGAP